MAQVGTSWSMWNKWNKEAGLQIYVEQVEQEQGGLSTWNKWNKDKGSVELNLSTAKVGLQGCEKL